MDELDAASEPNSEQLNPQTKEATPVQPTTPRLHSDSPAVSVFVEVPTLKRKRSLRTSSSKPDSDRPSQPPVDDQANERTSRSSRPSRWRMDCVLITTLPPVPRKKPAPPGPSGGEDDRLPAKTKKRGKQKRQVGQQGVARTSVISNSRSHSVSSLRPPLFEPVSIDPSWKIAY